MTTTPGRQGRDEDAGMNEEIEEEVVDLAKHVGLAKEKD